MNTTIITRFFATLMVACLASIASAQIDNFDSLNGYAAGVELRLNSEHQEFYQLRSPQAGFTVALEGNMTNRDVSPAEDRLERENDSGYFGLNVTWGTEAWTLGASIGKVDGSSDYLEVNSPAPTPTSGMVNSDTIVGQLWVVFTSGDFTMSGSLTSSSTDYDATRRSDLGSSTAKFDGSGAFGFIKIAYDFSVSDNLVLTPFGGIIWASADADGFTEQGTAADRRIVGNFSSDESNLALGLRLAPKEGQWKPSVTVGWLNELSSDPAQISVKAINGFDLGVGAVPNASDSLFYVGLGLEGAFEDSWSVRGSIDFFTGGDEEQTGFSFGVRHGF
jgi:outer membrane autotransporter protein